MMCERGHNIPWSNLRLLLVLKDLTMRNSVGKSAIGMPTRAMIASGESGIEADAGIGDSYMTQQCVFL